MSFWKVRARRTSHGQRDFEASTVEVAADVDGARGSLLVGELDLVEQRVRSITCLSPRSATSPARSPHSVRSRNCSYTGSSTGVVSVLF
jgi:hypothetical protein